MSTAEVFLQPEDIEDFVQETKGGDYLFTIGDEGREIGLCPVMTFYIYNTPDEFVDLCRRVISIFNDFKSDVIDEQFQLVQIDDSDWLQPGDPGLPKDIMAVLPRLQSQLQSLHISATDQDSPAATARWAFSAIVDDGIGNSYTKIKLTLRNRWYRQNRAKWHEFAHHCTEILKPDQCYSGFEVGNGGFNIMGAYECDVLERISSEHFYGMDIDHPMPMGFHNYNREPGIERDVVLGAGIRTPTWCFLLSPYWLERLGKTEAEVRTELSDPRIEITSIPYPRNKIYPQGGNALWIRLGELDLYPVEQGVPELLVKANRLIRPIRCDHLQLLTLAPWDGDPNPRFGYEDSIRWMRRFDDDSDWPDARRRHSPADGSGQAYGEGAGLRAMPGEVVSRAGVWWTPALAGDAGRLRLQAGDRLPETANTDYGAVIWYWRADSNGLE